MYQQSIAEFESRFPMGLGYPAGLIYGQPGRLFYCSVPTDDPGLAKSLLEGEHFYAGMIDSVTMLIVSEEEMSKAFVKELPDYGPIANRTGDYNPNNAGLKTEHVDYWISTQ